MEQTGLASDTPVIRQSTEDTDSPESAAPSLHRTGICVFDNHRADDQSGIFRRAALVSRKTAVVTFCQFIPGNTLA